MYRVFCQAMILACMLWLAVIPVQARFSTPQPAPIERLLTNVAAYVEEHPEDAHGHYIMGRIHYMAFANRLPYVAQYGSKEPLPSLVWWWYSDGSEETERENRSKELALEEMGYAKSSDVPQEERNAYYQLRAQYDQELVDQNYPPRNEPNETAAQAGLALVCFKKALALNPNEPLYLLGIASLLEQYVTYLLSLETGLLPQVFAQFLLVEARDTYFSAYQMAIDEDLALSSRPLDGLNFLVGYESGLGFLRLLPPAPLAMLPQRGDSQPGSVELISTDHLPPDLAQQAQKVFTDLVSLEALPRGGVTPIIFSLEVRASLDNMVHTNHTVLFDLDGDGRTERWPWIQRHTALLVWDPQRSGRIRSGRQLLGTASWWLLFENGYQAMDALDNNRDRFLTGPELQGLRAWYDYNQDGQSQPGEVIDLDDLGVTKIATRSSSQTKGILSNAKGMILHNGNTVATYDWVVSPVK